MLQLAIASFRESLSPRLVDKSRQAFTIYSQLVVELQALVVDWVHHLYCLLLGYYRFDSFHQFDSHRRWIILLHNLVRFGLLVVRIPEDSGNDVVRQLSIN